MPSVIRMVGQNEITRFLKVPDGAYLQSYDPNSHDGIGEMAWTMDPAKALTFVDNAGALDCCWQVSTVHPTRADGRPNRPLTAFNVLIEKLP